MKAVIFDIDGTLIKTREDFWYIVFEEIIGKIGCENYSREEVKRFERGDRNTPRKKILEKIFGSESKTDEFHRLLGIYLSDFDKVKHFKSLYPDVKLVLDELEKREVIMGVVTDAPPFIAIPQRDYFLGNGYFSEFVMTHKTHLKDKPSPDGLLYCMKQLGAEEAIFVGDSDSDIIAAQSAGIESVWIDRKEHDIYTQPNRIIETLYELL